VGCGQTLVHLHIGHFHFQPAALLFHGVGGVGAKVHDDLVHLRCVGHGCAGMRIHAVYYFDIRGKRGAQQLDGLARNDVDIDGGPLAARLAAENENLLHQVFGAVRGLKRLDQVAPRPGLGGQIADGEVGQPDDARENVVEIVRNAAGKHAQAFEPLRMLHLAFKTAALLLLADARGHVLHRADDADGAPVFAGQGHTRIFNVPLLAGFVQYPVFHLVAAHRLQRLGQPRQHTAPVLRVDVPLPAPPSDGPHLGGRVAHHLRHRTPPVDLARHDVAVVNHLARLGQEVVLLVLRSGSLGGGTRHGDNHATPGRVYNTRRNGYRQLATVLAQKQCLKSELAVPENAVNPPLDAVHPVGRGQFAQGEL